MSSPRPVTKKSLREIGVLRQLRAFKLRDSNPYREQQSCPVFTRLPYEIRRMIYVTVFTGAPDGEGTQVVHISTKTVSQLGYVDGPHHWVCTDPQGCGSRSISATCDGKRVRTVGGVWGLLASCRQINIEATPLLYSTNAFHVSGRRTCTKFFRNLPSVAMISIRSLRLCVSFLSPNNESSPPEQPLHMWETICTSLSNLSSLRRLQVDLATADEGQGLLDPWGESEFLACEVLDPLTVVGEGDLRQQQLKAPGGLFEVRGNWSEIKAQAMLGCLPSLEKAAFSLHGKDHIFESIIEPHRLPKMEAKKEGYNGPSVTVITIDGSGGFPFYS